MRIDLSAAPHRVDDLLRFLRMTGYVAREVDYAIIGHGRTGRVSGGAFCAALAVDTGLSGPQTWKLRGQVLSNTTLVGNPSRLTALLIDR